MTPRQPNRFSVISRSARSIGVSGEASGTGIARMHQVADAPQPRAEPAAGMDLVEVGRGEAAPGQQRDGERVAERHLHGGRGGGGEAHRAGFRRRRQGQGDIGRGRPASSRRGR